jgi:phenylacetate-CoA ligase
LLQHCYHQVPYYRRLLSEAGIGARPIESLDEFLRIPLLTREQVHSHPDELCAKSLPEGMVATSIQGTSGTNGVPIKVLQTNRVNLWWFAFYLRDLEWSDIDPRRRLAAIRFLRSGGKEVPGSMDGLTLPCWIASLDPLVETGRSYALDIRSDPRKQLAWLRRIDADYLLSMPSNLEFLASLLSESGQPLPALRAIQAIGETLTDAARERIENGFGVPVRNCYSASEAGYIASPCPLGHGLHVHSENVLLEVLDENNVACGPGETGRAVLTVLHNYRKPFVRYDILDDVTLGAGPCPCGRGLPLLSHVSGRQHPLFFLPNGRRKIVTGLYLDVKKVGGLHQMQLIQRAVDHIILRIVRDQTWTEEHAVRMRSIIHQEFGEPIRVDVETPDRLELPPGGKLKRIVIEVQEPSASG